MTSGALQQEYFLRQSWLVTPAPLEELREGRGRVGEAAALLSSKGAAGVREARSLTSLRGLTMGSAKRRLLVRSKDRRLTVRMASRWRFR